MIKTGYDAKLSAGAITAGGTLGILIPPVGHADRDGAGARRLGGRTLCGGLRARVPAGGHLSPLSARPRFYQSEAGTAGPARESACIAFRRLLREVIVGVVPLLALIAATLGTILAGVGDADRGGGGRRARRPAARRRLPKADLRRPQAGRLRPPPTSSMVLLLAVTSNIFGAVFARLGTANWITETHAGAAGAAGDDADPRDRADLPAGLAVRVAGDHPGLPADLLSRRGPSRARSSISPTSS